MTKRQMLREILEYDNTDECIYKCPLECGPVELSDKGESLWPRYCSIYTNYCYEGRDDGCFGSKGRYSCEVMQAIRFATGGEKKRLWQLSKRQLADVHAQLIWDGAAGVDMYPDC